MWIFAGGVSGFLAVLLGAFGAHGLQAQLSSVEDFSKRMDWWETAAHYHLVHSLLLVGIGIFSLSDRMPAGALRLSGIAAVVGVILFSGSLYTMTLTGIRALGAITPLGGLAFLLAWATLAFAGWKVSGQ